ncbi:hypothetical protein [Flavobacterium sp. WV_118_3]|jgi:hypothetical protein|uniref:hypothetical protein n=1 Tax=Flavobacterium sp. WV_118_3 TaxID=3151764 RepID=UPI0032194AEB
MKYFKIYQETDSKVIGKYPQVKELKIDFHQARASQWGIISQWKTEDDIPDLNNFVLHHNSRLSDCVSNNFVITSSGLFISEKCYQVFESFKVNGNFYPMTIFRRGTPHQYRFLCYEIEETSSIDWEHSDFIAFNSIEEEYGNTIKVINFEDFKIQNRKLFEAKEDWGLTPKSLKFTEYFDITPAFGIGLICNENVKNAIEENKLTGFVFGSIDVDIVFD